MKNIIKKLSLRSRTFFSRFKPSYEKKDIPRDNIQTQAYGFYSEKAKGLGFNGISFILSFDCDTPEDIEVVRKIDRWLEKLKIPRIYAVPGVMLLQGEREYREISEQGGIFLNHGAHAHANWRDGRYWSTTFYNEMSAEEVISDIQNGHELCRRLTGKLPNGFRAPHFGYFQEPEQRKIIYQTIQKMNYQYSSSTLPGYGLMNGPVVKEGEIFEIPLSGSWAFPNIILDSWSNIYSPYYPLVGENYFDLLKQTVDNLLEHHYTGLLNYYVDPSHVAGNDYFYRGIAYCLDKEIPFITYEQAIDVIRQK